MITRCKFHYKSGLYFLNFPSNVSQETIFTDGFESMSTWDKTNNSFGHSLTALDTAKKKSGSYSGRIDDNYPRQWSKYVYSDTWTPINNSQDTYYTVSGWVYVEDVTTNGSLPNLAKLWIVTRKQGERGYPTGHISTSSTKEGTWEYLSKTVLVPADVKEINVRIENARLGKVWFDDVKIVKGNTSQTVIVEESNYYPFGLKHKGYNNVVSSNGNSTAQKFGYNGKELSEELGLDWHDFGARNYNASLGRWMNLDPHSDTYMSLSPYNSFANNPISFIDPDGKDILFWQKNKEGEWKQVEFSQLNKDTQKAVEAFAKTKEGNSFLKDFANEGDKIGEVEFGEDGKYSKHELAVGEFSQYYGVQGASGVKNKKGDGKLTLELAVNTTGDYDHSRVAQMANVIGHESFVHLSQYVSNLIEAFDSGDMKQVEKLLNDRKSFAGKFKTGEHSGYVKGSKDFKRMRAYISQLKGVLNPKEVEKAKQQDVKTLKQYGNK